ncbi:phosphopentomutase [Pseudoroseicyclus tamaricis]|uniref:Phosphopentomutase n=1 Tax=Pseudoroseicyclus tamaricis TaxID=2705421 RepID=A0A6B2JKV7_9RHOB|nr:phosphopentomutase [Pseudoroseicyclus tamaricis]NDV02151.1 phosphopentomutase [Pseudoroseicyclus tamaricis]
MSRAFLVVMDSVGIGGAPDAADYANGKVPDTGANTLGHIAEACATGRAEEGRSGPLRLPALAGLGLGQALHLASGFPDPWPGAEVSGAWGAATEVSRGKDTPSGHWELAGVPVPWDWGYFPNETPAFPPELMAEVAAKAGTEGTLANCHASGTTVIAEYGEEHLRTGWPICYTSVDSVFQIAAHEEAFGLERLLRLCEDIAPTLHAMKIGRVIARPFLGSAPADFKRTAHRRDYAIAPPAPTLCDWVSAAGRPVHAVGKIGDIFSMQGIDDVTKGPDESLMADLHRLAGEAEEGSLTFANFVEFDSLYGHRRDVSGYARHLEWFDAELARLIGHLRPGDLLIVTADHGNDPTFAGTDHTRERVPVLVHGLGLDELGLMAFTDVAELAAGHLQVPRPEEGR